MSKNNLDIAKPKVSLILPIYNVGNYLEKSLDSAINQTLSDIEIICINDASTDNSLTILQEYAKKDSRIKIIDQENQGVSVARNNGLKIAKGEYIYFLDPDDWIEANTLELCYKAIIENDADLLSFGAKVESQEAMTAKQIARIQRYYTIRFSGRQETSDYFVNKTTTTLWDKLFKNDIIQKYDIQFPAGLLAEDCAFYYNYALHAKSIYYLNHYLYHYLQRADSAVGKDKRITKVLSYNNIGIFRCIYEHHKKHNALKKYKKRIQRRYKKAIKWTLKKCPADKKHIALASAIEIAEQSEDKFLTRTPFFLSLKIRKIFAKRIA